MKVKVLRTTIASGKRILQGAIVNVSDKDAAILIGSKKAREVEDGDKNKPVKEYEAPKENNENKEDK